jgi:hypothetical protein
MHGGRLDRGPVGAHERGLGSLRRIDTVRVVQAKPSGRLRHSSPVLRVALVLAIAGWAGCFDSDEVFKVAAVETSGDPSTTSVSTTATTFPADDDGDSTGDPMGDKTCIDAIDCVRGCILELATTNLPEPDLSCFLECTKPLSEQEALKLLRLGNCISDQCVVAGACVGPSDDDTGGSTGEGDSSTGEGDSSTGEGSTTDGDDGGGNGGGDDGPIDACLLCILNGMLDPEPEGCVDLADSCRQKD